MSKLKNTESISLKELYKMTLEGKTSVVINRGNSEEIMTGIGVGSVNLPKIDKELLKSYEDKLKREEQITDIFKVIKDGEHIASKDSKFSAILGAIMNVDSDVLFNDDSKIYVHYMEKV